MGLSRAGQPEIEAQPAQGRSGWGTAGLGVTVGDGGEGHFVVFSLYTCPGFRPTTPATCPSTRQAVN